MIAHQLHRTLFALAFLLGSIVVLVSADDREDCKNEVISECTCLDNFPQECDHVTLDPALEASYSCEAIELTTTKAARRERKRRRGRGRRKRDIYSGEDNPTGCRCTHNEPAACAVEVVSTSSSCLALTNPVDIEYVIDSHAKAINQCLTDKQKCIEILVNVCTACYTKERDTAGSDPCPDDSRKLECEDTGSECLCSRANPLGCVSKFFHYRRGTPPCKRLSATEQAEAEAAHLTAYEACTTP